MTSNPSTPTTAAGRELLDWCNRVQYDDRNRERILAIEKEAAAAAMALPRWDSLASVRSILTPEADKERE